MQRMPITFLMYDALGGGGVARTVTNTANLLAEHRDVQVVSLLRRRGDQLGFPLDPRVSVDFLVDRRQGLGPVQRRLDRLPTRLALARGESAFSLRTDHLLAKRIRSLDPGVLVSTRPSLHLAATRWAPPGVHLVGQEHSTFASRMANPRQAALLSSVVPRLDAYVVLTRGDAESYRRWLPDMATRVEHIPNALPWPLPAEPSPLDAKVIVSAGRLTKQKGAGRLLQAFHAVARAHPDWQLHIYGRGPEQAALERSIERRGLQSQVRLLGYDRDFQSVLQRASMFVLASHSEGFSMVLIEAMSVGLPLVSFDCPQGPREIVENEKNGFLVPDGDIHGFAVAMRTLIENVDLRRRCGERGRERAQAYTQDVNVEEWLALFDRFDT
ncbi:MAG TPA: glycosyltransferase family 4 protein [Nocardioidaceae bacterium]|nr:glycosyltransferase family 4 protein [Nocardioidaceae bacterium]